MAGYTSTDLANLKAALATGAEDVQIGDRKIRYRSVAEIKKLIKEIQEDLEGASTTTSANLIQATYRKGES